MRLVFVMIFTVLARNEFSAEEFSHSRFCDRMKGSSRDDWADGEKISDAMHLSSRQEHVTNLAPQTWRNCITEAQFSRRGSFQAIFSKHEHFYERNDYI